MTALDDAISFHIHECKDPECNVSLAALDEVDSLRAKAKRAEAAEAERDTLRVQLDFEMAHSQRMMEERDRANAGFAALSKEYDKAMTRLAAHGEKVTA